MRYQIQEISTEAATGLTYVLVHFWIDEAARLDGDPPDLVNDFRMQLLDEAERVVTNGDGWLKRLSDGVFMDPETLEPDDETEWERETYTVDTPAVVLANIEAYIERAEARGYSGDHTGDASKPFRIGGVERVQRVGEAIERVAASGVANRQDVRALRGAVRSGGTTVSPR
jgi:hypothetical protein